jgi:hypothetical protein
LPANGVGGREKWRRGNAPERESVEESIARWAVVFIISSGGLFVLLPGLLHYFSNSSLQERGNREPRFGTRKDEGIYSQRSGIEMTYGPGATSLSRLLWVILGSIFHAPPVVSEIPMLFVPVLSFFVVSSQHYTCANCFQLWVVCI